MSLQTQVITGPCALSYNGVTYFSQGDVILNFNRNTVDLAASHLGVYDSRQREVSITVQFTPVGQSALLDAIITAVSSKKPGESMVPGGISSATFAVTGVNGTDLLTATGHTFSNGDLVAFQNLVGGSGLAEWSRYYVRDVSGNDFKLANTSGGSAINFTTDITSGSTIGAVLEKPLVITPLSNAGGNSRIWTFYRAGITAVGNYTLSATAQINSQITFTTLESQVPTGSWYTTAAYSAPSSGLLDDFNGNFVQTPPCKLIWADDPDTLASGDYTLLSEDGWQVAINLTTNSHYRENIGIADVTFGDFNCTVSGKLANAFDYQDSLVGEHSLPGIMPDTTRPGQRATRKKITFRSLIDDSVEGFSGLQEAQDLLTFVAAEWTQTNLQWSGGTANRTGSVTFKCCPIISSGARTYITPTFEL